MLKQVTGKRSGRLRKTNCSGFTKAISRATPSGRANSRCGGISGTDEALEQASVESVRYELADRSGGDEKKGGLPYKLSSTGPDGQPDTDDDIRLMSDNEKDSGTGNAGGK